MKKIFVSKKSELTHEMENLLDSGYDGYRVRIDCDCSHSPRRNGALLLNESGNVEYAIVRCKECAKKTTEPKYNEKRLCNCMSIILNLTLEAIELTEQTDMSEKEHLKNCLLKLKEYSKEVDQIDDILMKFICKKDTGSTQLDDKIATNRPIESDSLTNALSYLIKARDIIHNKKDSEVFNPYDFIKGNLDEIQYNLNEYIGGLAEIIGYEYLCVLEAQISKE